MLMAPDGCLGFQTLVFHADPTDIISLRNAIIIKIHCMFLNKMPKSEIVKSAVT